MMLRVFVSRECSEAGDAARRAPELDAGQAAGALSGLRGAQTDGAAQSGGGGRQDHTAKCAQLLRQVRVALVETIHQSYSPRRNAQNRAGT